MAVLRPYIMPTVGIPQPVIASRRPKNMAQQSFFQQQAQPQQIQQPNPMAMQSTQQTRDTPRMPEFEQGPLTGEYIQEQLTKLQQRPERPMLEPGARIKSANAELVQPSTFQVYYEQLAAINQSGQEMLGAEVARSAFKRAQALAALQNQQPPEFGGVGKPRRGGSGGGPNPGTSTPLSGDRAQARSIMQRMAQQWGWTGREWDALVRLIMKESGFNPRAANPTSSARGLFQKMVSIHGPLEPTIEGQIMWGFNYIKGRYGSPSRALQFHLGHNWY